MKKLDCIQAESLRTLIKAINEIGVQREDLVSITERANSYTALFYVEPK